MMSWIVPVWRDAEHPNGVGVAEELLEIGCPVEDAIVDDGATHEDDSAEGDDNTENDDTTDDDDTIDEDDTTEDRTNEEEDTIVEDAMVEETTLVDDAGMLDDFEVEILPTDDEEAGEALLDLLVDWDDESLL